MDNAGTAPLHLELYEAGFGAASNEATVSPSHRVRAASTATIASLHLLPLSLASSMQMVSSKASFERETKRPRILRRCSRAISATSTNLSGPVEHHSIDGAHEHMNMNYSQTFEMASQSSSLKVAASSTIPTDIDLVVGWPYWSNESFGTEAMTNSTSKTGDTDNSPGYGKTILNGGQSQIYGSGIDWGGQDLSMSIHPIQQCVQCRMADGSCKPEEPHDQQPQQPHQQLQPDGTFASPYWSLWTENNSQHMHSDYPIVNGPAQRTMLSNTYGPRGGSATPTTPHQTPSTPAGWRQSAFDGIGGSTNSANMRSGSNRCASTTSLGKEIKPKMLVSYTSSLHNQSPVQQGGGGAAPKSERPKTDSRTIHNDVERKYRTNLKDRIAKLRAAVPALHTQQHGESGGTTSHVAPKISKAMVLSKATEYIQQLENANRAMAAEQAQLMERLQALETMLQNGGARPPQYLPNHGTTMVCPRGF